MQELSLKAQLKRERRAWKQARAGILGIYAVGRIKRMPGSFEKGKKK